jgi:hypothetical protein
MILDQHHLAGLVARVEPARGVGDDQPARAEALQQVDRQRDVAGDQPS